MDASINKIEDNKHKKHIVRILPYIFYAAIMLIFHVFGYELTGDDVGVVDNLKPTLPEEFSSLQRSYNGWSSRIIINPIIWIMYHFDIKVWGIINILILCMGFYFVEYISGSNKMSEKRIIALLIMLIFPFEVITDVGWITTSVSYLWPLVAGLFSCISLRKYLDGEKADGRLLILICLATIFASNKEELSLSLALIFLYFVCLSVREKRFSPLIAVQFIIALVSVLFHLLSEGNSARYNASSMTIELSILDKGIVGFISTLHHLFYGYDYLFLCFCIIVCVLVFALKSKMKYKIISFVPVGVCIVSMIVGMILSEGIFDSKALNKYVYPDNKVFKGCSSYQYSGIILPLIISLVGLVCLLIGIYCIASNTKKYIILVVILASGFIGRMTIGFSGNGFEGYPRTYTFLYYIIIITTLVLLIHVIEKIPEERFVKVNKVITCMAVIGVIRCLLGLGIV